MIIWEHEVAELIIIWEQETLYIRQTFLDLKVFGIDRYISTIFSREKKDGRYRLILSLKQFILGEDYIHLKLTL